MFELIERFVIRNIVYFPGEGSYLKDQKESEPSKLVVVMKIYSKYVLQLLEVEFCRSENGMKRSDTTLTPNLPRFSIVLRLMTKLFIVTLRYLYCYCVR